MANIAYVRVSTIEQNADRQMQVLKKWFIDKASAQIRNDLKFSQCLTMSGKEIPFTFMSLVGWQENTKNLLEITETMDAKGVHLVSNPEYIDTSTPAGKLMVTMVRLQPLSVKTFWSVN